VSDIDAKIDDFMATVYSGESTCICGAKYKQWQVDFTNPHLIHDSVGYSYYLTLKRLLVISRYFK